MGRTLSYRIFRMPSSPTDKVRHTRYCSRAPALTSLDRLTARGRRNFGFRTRAPCREAPIGHVHEAHDPIVPPFACTKRIETCCSNGSIAAARHFSCGSDKVTWRSLGCCADAASSTSTTTSIATDLMVRRASSIERRSCTPLVSLTARRAGGAPDTAHTLRTCCRQRCVLLISLCRQRSTSSRGRRRRGAGFHRLSAG